MQEFRLTVPSDTEEQRVDKYIPEVVPGITRSYLQKVLADGGLFVNGKKVKGSFKIGENDTIEFAIPDASMPDIPAENIPLDILYEDEDLIVVNKPKGMVVHPAPGHYSGTMVNALMYHCGDHLSGINGVLRPGIVHRIDMDTTGSVIACKNDLSHNSIAAQLKEHSINRKYLAIVLGRITEDEGIVNAPIGRDDKDRKKMAINKLHGKEAITHYRVLERFKEYSLVECRLETGRTHQIRVHMASIGHPILGDSVYTKASWPYHLQGQCLHAYVLGFVHPRTGEYVETLAPLPEYFSHLLEVLQK